MQPVPVKGKRSEEWRSHPQGMDSRTHVVPETRESKLGGAGATTDRVGRFEYDDGPALLRQSDGSCQSVWSCADDYSIILGTLHRRTCLC
jgi:hypothetical protein